MLSWTVGVEGIVQKASSAEEMHPRQHEIHFPGPLETPCPRRSNLNSSSDSEHVIPHARGQRGSGALTLLLLFSLVDPSLAQSGSLNPPPQKSDSLGDSLRHSEGKEIHIFYIHGIGSDGPNDYDSLALRSSICAYLRDCTSLAGTPIGEWDYADRDQFRPDAPFRNLSTWTSRSGRVRMNGALPLLTRYIFNSLGPMAKNSTSMN